MTSSCGKNRQVVKVSEYGFHPALVNVKVGGYVTWINDEKNDKTLSHTINSSEFESYPLTLGKEYTQCFQQPGVIKYYCHYYPFMTGEIHVEKGTLDNEKRKHSLIAIDNPAVEAPVEVTVLQKNAFVHAASLSQTMVLQRWIDKGHDVNAFDEEGTNAVIAAASKNNLESLALLIKHGANIKTAQKSDGKTALHVVCEWGRLEAAQVLLNHGAECSKCVDSDKRTPLHWATRNGHLDLVLLLLTQFVDPYQMDEHNQTVFNIAADWKRTDILGAIQDYVNGPYPKWVMQQRFKHVVPGLCKRLPRHLIFQSVFPFLANTLPEV